MTKKLISLHTEDTAAHFDNIFNDEIVIEPDTELAFHSCCLRLNNFRVNVNNNNKVITLKIGTTAAMRHVIESGDYSDNQVQYLLEEIQNGLNQQLNILNETDNGQQIRLGLSRKNVVSLDLIKAAISQAAIVESGGTYVKDTELFLFGGSVTMDGATGTFSRTGSQGIADGLTNFIHGRVPVTRGCGFCSIRVTALRAFAANVFDGAIMMLTTESNPDKHETRTTSLGYVRIPEKVGDPYQFTSKELLYNETDLTSNNVPILCALNDIIQIELSGGNYLIAVYRTGVTFLKTLLFSTETTRDSVYNDSAIGRIAPPLYMTVGLFGPSFSGKINYISDPYTANPPTNSLALLDVEDDPPTFTKGNQYDHVLTFQSLDLASSLGFDERVITITDTDTCTFLAPKSITRTTHPSNYKIEMLNIQLESYDSQKEGRMNILATIPISQEFKDQQLSILNFEPTNMFYLSIRNKTKLSLRNIKARIIDANNNPINLLGFSSLNLLIKSKEE